MPKPITTGGVAAPGQETNLVAAIRDYSLAIRVRAGVVDAYVNRGGAHQAKHELDAAISDYDKPSKSKLTRPVLIYARAPRNRQRESLNGRPGGLLKTIQLDPN